MIRKPLLRLLLAGGAAASGGAAHAAAPPPSDIGRVVIGRLEEVAVMPERFVLRAKIDTGALSSSLNAPHYRLFERDGRKLVSFEVVNKRGRRLRLEREVVRTARIKRVRRSSQQRPVILLTLCLGGYQAQTEVNLVDRTGFNYPLLIGRRFLTGKFVIDPARVWTSRPVCEPAPAEPP